MVDQKKAALAVKMCGAVLADVDRQDWLAAEETVQELNELLLELSRQEMEEAEEAWLAKGYSYLGTPLTEEAISYQEDTRGAEWAKKARRVAKLPT